jgi:hypothetical protein
VNTYYKYGRTPADPTPHWYEFLFDGSTGAEILSDRVELHFVDGQRGDDDQTVNGQVVDPGGPGNRPPPPRLLTALGPANVWIGLKNHGGDGLRVDVLVQAFVNSQLVGSGQLNNVETGGTGFANARLNTIPLTLSSGPFLMPPGAQLTLYVSVRRTCFGGGDKNGKPQLWYNGQPVDSGAAADAGSRFDATISSSTRTYFLRQGFALNEQAGSARRALDVSVSDKIGCSARPFTSFGSWSTAVP